MGDSDSNNSPENLTGIHSCTNSREKEKYFEETLLEIIENTRMIISNIHQGIIIYDTDLRYREWNPFMEELTWFKKEEVIWKHPSEIFPFLSEHWIIEKLESVLNGWSEIAYEVPLSSLNTELSWFLSGNSKPILDPQWNIVGILGVITDQTQCKKDQENLDTVQSLLLSTANNATDAIFTKSLDWKYSFVNKAAASLFWKPISEIIGKDDSELFPESYWLASRAEDKSTMEREQTVTYEKNVQTANGETKIFLATEGPIYDNEWKLTGLFSISRDITTRKKNEKELIRLNRTLRIISECNQILLQVETEQELLDRVCNIIIEEWWYRMCWIWYKEEENKTKNIIPTAQSGFEDWYLSSVNITYDENNPLWQGPTGKAVREWKPFISHDIPTDPNFNPWRVDAIKRWYNSSIALPIKFYNNEVIGALMVYAGEKDAFTNEEIKLLEELSHDLSRGIQFIRTKEEKKKSDELLRKSEEQLQFRQKMDSMWTLAAGICHDFNNLLMAIMWNLDLLRMDNNLSDTEHNYVDNALTSSNRAAELIKQLQKLSINTISEKWSVDIYKIINEVFTLLASTTDKIVNKIIDFKAWEYYVMWNFSELHQVLLNLGTNSYKAIEERWCKSWDFIKISAEQYKCTIPDEKELSEWDYIHIIFEDNWRWMSEEVLLKAFDPLFTTRKRGWQRGQGLWLAMVYNIITRNHKGYINIESKEWIWTTVHMYLPKALQEEKPQVKAAVNNFSWTETVLVIEDEEMIYGFLKTALEMKGYKVIIAKDWQEGLDKYLELKDSIDLVILDLTMPRMSGHTVLEKMLEIKGDVKVIISSGQSDSDLQQWILSHAKWFAHKPYDLKTIYTTVRAVLDEWKEEEKKL